MNNINLAIGIVAVLGALWSFVDVMRNLPLVVEFDDTEYPNEEDE